jgi:NADPH2:quinone reductase
VNPLTALGMVETMRLEGHTALVHTAAASNLGRMLVRICLADGVGLVNVVRRPEQVELLRSLGAVPAGRRSPPGAVPAERRSPPGAVQVCDSSSPSFAADLTAALEVTGATIGFDAIGGGSMASQILTCMEAAIVARGDGAFSRYGSTVHKQVYIYGTLDRGPTEVVRTFGTAWGIGGWLLMPFLERIGPDAADALRRRVVDELHTTFASTYTQEVSLSGLLDLDHLTACSRMATGEKYLVVPSRG